MSNEMKFADRTVMVGGAASGIGKATALEFARQGALEVGADLDEAGGRALVAQIQQGGGKAEFVRTDVSKEDDVAAHRRASSPANTKNRKEKFIDSSSISTRERSPTETSEEE